MLPWWEEEGRRDATLVGRRGVPLHTVRVSKGLHTEHEREATMGSWVGVGLSPVTDCLSVAHRRTEVRSDIALGSVLRKVMGKAPWPVKELRSREVCRSLCA